MERNNLTSWTEFILVGFLSQVKAPDVILALFVFMYVMVLCENSLLLYVIHVNSSLHTPMYFFLSQLSFIDICLTLAIAPKVTIDFLTQNSTISLTGCSAQIFFTLTMAMAECILLAAMSYDRYVAICKPLQYPVLMRRCICLALTAGVWFGASLQALVLCIYVLLLHYCDSNVIHHFFCDVPSMLKLSCSDTSVIEKMTIICSFEVLFLSLLIILVSYSYIIGTVVQSIGTSHKALGTCFSHLSVVILFFGAAMLKYLRPRSYRTPYQDDIVSVICTTIAPMLNPLIYSLRNRDVLAALKRLFSKSNL